MSFSLVNTVIVDGCSIYQEVSTCLQQNFRELLTAGTPVVKENDRPRLPSQSDLEVMSLGDMVHQVLDEPIGFFLLPSLDAGNPLVINEQRLLSSDRMNPDKRVKTLHWVFAAKTSVGTCESTDTLRAVVSHQAVKHLSESG